MKNVRITIPIGIDDRHVAADGRSVGGVSNNYLTFIAQVPDRFTPDDIARTLAGKIEDVLEKYVKFGKD